MDLLVLIPSFLRALATALTSPAFAVPRYTAMLADIAALGALLVEMGGQGHAKLQALADHITALVQADQAPTAGDWATLGQLHVDARKLIEGYIAAKVLAQSQPQIPPLAMTLADPPIPVTDGAAPLDPARYEAAHNALKEATGSGQGG